MGEYSKARIEKDKEVGARLIRTIREVVRETVANQEKYIELAYEIEDFCDKKILDVHDIEELFDVGIVKARKIMQQVPVKLVGRKFYCTRKDLYMAFKKGKLHFNWNQKN